jgi:hypothetical protein
MNKARTQELKYLSDEFQKYYWLMRDWIEGKKGISDYDGARAEEGIQRIIMLYNQAEKMPVWPFDRNTIGKVATAVIIPLVIVAIQIFSTQLLSGSD